MAVEITVPEIGESIQEVHILRWMKQQGDRVEKDEEVVEIESDKATVAIPSPAAGRLEEILKDDGDFAEVGDVIARLAKGDDEPDSSDGEEAAEKGTDVDEVDEEVSREEEPAETETDKTDDEAEADEKKPRRSKTATKKVRREKEPAKPADEAKKQGKPPRQAQRRSGDVREESDPVEGKAALKTRQKPDAKRSDDKQPARRGEGNGRQPRREEETRSPKTSDRMRTDQPVAAKRDTDGQREEETVSMSILRRTIARRLVEAQQNAALVTTFNEIDMQEAIELRKEFSDQFREQYDIKLGYMSLFVKAAVEALKQFPEVNAKVVGDDIVYRNYFDIGIAIGSDKGLVVPVLRDCQRLSFAEIEQQIDDFAARASDGRLEPDELEGGTFTITNGGIYGSLLSTPIVNPPQSGVLGMHAIGDRPVARDGQVVIRPMMYVALTYDHRIVDGREAVGFLGRIREIVETPARLLLEV